MEKDQTNNSPQPTGISPPGQIFLTYVRTLQFMKTRLKGIDEGKAVHILQTEIEGRFFIYPKHDRKKELAALVAAGELEISEIISPHSGRTMKTYKARRAGAMDLYLIKPQPKEYGSQIKLIKSHLMRVSLPPGAASTPYFDAFLRFRTDLLDLFFTVDAFAGRIHTPITNFHRTHRPYILIDGQHTIGLDVTTMQPLLLGKILLNKVGKNEFTNWIDAGEDVYIKLQQAAGLATRDEAKKRFFEILFAPPSNSLADMFGDNDWIRWINKYKRADEPSNPHGTRHHTNLAWLLQTTEVEVMRKVWQALNDAGIVFLSVHDEIIVKEMEMHRAESLFRKVLDMEFAFYNLNIKGAICSTPSDIHPNTPLRPEPMPQPIELVKLLPVADEVSRILEPDEPVTWDAEISELEAYFAAIELPTEPIKLNPCSTITNAAKFVESHFAAVKAQNGNQYFFPYLSHLKDLQRNLIKNQN